MNLTLIILSYFIGIPLGIILWKIALQGININYNDKFTSNNQKEKAK